MTLAGNHKRWHHLAAPVCLILVAAGVVFDAQRLFRADVTAAQARHDVQRWVSGQAKPPSASQWEATQAALQEALRITPSDASLHDRMGDLYVAAGQRDWTDGPTSARHFEQAIVHYQRALDLRPAEPITWAMLAAAVQSAGGPRATVQAAWQTAQKLGPFEGHVQPVLMQVVLADWDESTPAMQQWALGVFDRADAATRAQINVLAKAYGFAFTADAAASTPSR
jgi:tetratricopeptide (TPR) repeat protein